MYFNLLILHSSILLMQTVATQYTVYGTSTVVVNYSVYTQ